VAKLVDALALGASAARHEGSSPFPGTKRRIPRKGFSFCAREESQLLGFRKDLNRGREVLYFVVKVDFVAKPFPGTDEKQDRICGFVFVY